MSRANSWYKPLLTVEETSLLLDMSASKIYRSIRRGDFPLKVYVINGRKRIVRAEVIRFVNGDLV